MPERVSLKQEEFQEWKLHPVTQALEQALKNWKKTFQERWAAGEFTDQSQYGTAILNAKAIGNCELIERVLNLDMEQLEGELEDGQS